MQPHHREEPCSPCLPALPGEPAETRLHSPDPPAPQAGLLELLAYETGRYTMGEHSSVPLETAQELLASIRFCLDLAQEGGPCHHSLPQLLEQGRERARGLTARARALYAQVLSTDPGTGNLSYRDTVEGIGQFFRLYDIRFGAHLIPCDIDYQLLLPVPDELQGVCWLRDYLNRLLLENRFLGRFPRAAVGKLLHALHPQHRLLHLSQAEPVLTAALGLGLLGRTPWSLRLDRADRAQLLQLLTPWNAQEAEWLIGASADRLARELSLCTPAQRGWLRAASLALLPRLQAAVQAGDLAGLFLDPDRPAAPPPPRFQDGAPMDDAALRRLIAALQAMPALQDRLALVRERVHSLRDLCALLDTCFWHGEHSQVLALLQPPEQAALRELLLQRYGGERLPSWMPGPDRD